jgi:Fe-Mn family superoxide dismutase
MMGPNNHNMPSELEAALVESFGSIDKFKEDFVAAGVGQFGSGCVG